MSRVTSHWHQRRRTRGAALAALVASFGLAATLGQSSAFAGTEPERFRPTADLELDDLQQALRDASPDLEAAQLQVELARAGVRQSRLLPNPELDLSWGTIPIGPTNPPDLDRPLANVPNYGVGISFPILIGKRGPRIREAEALARGSQAEFDAVTRALALELAETLGELAIANLRLEGFEQVVDDMQRSVTAAEQRAELSFGVPLEIDLLKIELARSQSLTAAARSDITAALAECAALLGRACDEFASGAEARAYLDTWIDADSSASFDLDRRPDVVALGHHVEAAQAAGKLARAQAIPDPTLRFGYLRDQFLFSGNHLNSLSLSLEIPLPVFDRGQAQRDAAAARQRRVTAERDKRLAAGQAQLPVLVEQVELERERRRMLRDEAIPTAKSVATSIEGAAEQRLMSISEVLQARRVVRELLLEEADAYAAAYQARIDLLRVSAPEVQ